MTSEPVTALVPMVPMPFAVEVDTGRAGHGFAHTGREAHRVLYVGYESERDRAIYGATGRVERPLRARGRLLDLYV